MAVDRFTRFKILRALWARAKGLLAALGAPHEREARQRAFRWQQIQVAERQIRDGIVRGTGDPDSYARLQGADLRPLSEPRRPDVRNPVETPPPRASSDVQRQQWDLAVQQWHRMQQHAQAYLAQQRQRQDPRRGQ